MYITTGTSKHYAVLDANVQRGEVRYTLAEAPAELGASIKLWAADGTMCLRTDTTADYRHPRIEGCTVVLSNTAPTEPVELTLEDLRTAKLAELNAACDAAIASGCDVTLSDGTAGHISLTIADQINLSTAQGAVASGAAGYAYHLDGALCEIYPAADIAIMASAATAHVLYHQTYCNHARQWAKRCATEAELEAVTYGAALPDDLAEHMAAVLAAAKEGADA